MYLFKEDHLVCRFFFQAIIFKGRAAGENPLKRIFFRHFVTLEFKILFLVKETQPVRYSNHN